MKNLNRNIVLVEVGGSHTECMHLQIKALQSKGYNIFLICNRSLCAQFLDKSVFADTLVVLEPSSSFKDKISEYIKVRKFLKKHNIQSMVFNTLEAARILASLPLPMVKNYIGVIHKGTYATKSGTFKYLTRKVKKIFVLSDNILNNMGTPSRPIAISSFYPILFQKYPEYQIEKKDGEFWFCAPGSANSEQKDVMGLVNKMKNNKLSDNIKIIVLGFMEKEMIDKIKRVDTQNNFVLFNHFVESSIFAAYIKKVDVILPLIHKCTIENFYMNTKISGTYNISYGYKIPMLMQDYVKTTSPDFEGISMTYKMDNIVDRINEIAKKPKEYYDSLHVIQNHPYFNVEKQCEKYIELIERE